MVKKPCLPALFLLIAGSLLLAGCSRESDDGEDDSPRLTTPSSATTPAPAPAPTPTVAYVQDLKPVFDSDCVRCHGGSRPSAGYSMSTYAGVMALVRAGDASSRLVVATRSNGSMYSHFSGDRAGKSDLVRRWVVDNGAAQTR